MKADIKLPDKITGIIAELNDAGYEAYAVGGCVRDLFMGKIPNDYDVTTSALPEQIKAVFNGCKIYDVGIEHGTVLIVYKETPVEITTYRRESGYSDKRRPDKVEFVGKLSEDLKRRDFTVNAIAFDGESTVDIFGGINDIRNKIIRCVGNPDDRFNEDALRIIRALRFSSRLGFEIEAKTKEALQKNAKNLSFVAAERIQKEFIRLVEGEHFYKTAAEFKDVIKLAAQSKALLNISALQSAEPDFAVRFALMFGSDGERVLDNLKFSGAHRKKGSLGFALQGYKNRQAVGGGACQRNRAGGF